MELGSLQKASARVSLANVPRGVFSLNPAQATAMAAQIEAGSTERTVRVFGAVDLAVAQYARTQNVSREAARRAIIENIETSAKPPTDTPDASAVTQPL